MPRKTKQEAEQTREAILEAAAMTFSEVGVNRASVDLIATRAGVTRGAVYHHFKNKLDVFRALFDQLYTPFTEMILEDLEVDHPHPIRQLSALCTHLFDDLVVHPRKKRILAILFLKCDYSGEMEEILEEMNQRKNRSIELFSRYFTRAQERGHLPPNADPHILTLSALSYLTGMTYEFLRNPALFDIETHAAPMIEYYYRGLANMSDPEAGSR